MMECRLLYVGGTNAVRKEMTAISVFLLVVSLLGISAGTAADNSARVPAPYRAAVPAPAAGPASQSLETGPETACKADSECWCRKFTGAKFNDGKIQSRCVRNQCGRCMYE